MLLRDNVYESLRSDILTCRLAPGDDMREQELAERYAVSRQPVREALLRLERQPEPQEVARIGKRDRIDAIALARLHGDEMFALQPQQGLAHRLAADRIALGELLLAHVLARRKAAG